MGWSEAARMAAAEARRRNAAGKVKGMLGSIFDRKTGSRLKVGAALRGNMRASNLSYRDRIYRARTALLRSK